MREREIMLFFIVEDKILHIEGMRGAWLAQSGKWPTLDFDS